MKTVIYLGDGTQFIPGVPARDLSETEFMDLPKQLQESSLQSGLYRLPGDLPEKQVTEGIIDLKDGVSEAEATLAGKTLANRKVR